ncbi:MAG: transketolase [Puniceicoccales bacterium]|nr:transketolase [Puniceicoccales bacterium]
MDCLGNCEDCADLARCGECLSPKELAALREAARVSRLLVLDMVEAAGSGHLAMALDCAEIGAILFGKLLRCDGTLPSWLDRDRFVLSAGHASAFLYAWLHLAGFPMAREDLQKFRRCEATAGHPGHDPRRGVEITAGPLGQGIANAVGLALARKLLGSRLEEDADLLKGRIICLAGDGCIQEGVALEALVLAGLWRLDNIILIYDCNGITLDGPSLASNAVDSAALLDAIGWQVQVVDGHDLDALGGALERARMLPMGLPQAIVARTVAGMGVPAIEGSPRAHGCPIVGEEWARARQALRGGRKFFVPAAIRRHFAAISQLRDRERRSWQDLFREALDRRPAVAQLLGREKCLDQWLRSTFPKIGDEGKMVDLRSVSSSVLRAVDEKTGRLVSLSADLFHSTKTAIGDGKQFAIDGMDARNVQCGIREHAMGAMANGIAYDGIFRPIVSTFLVFSDYLRPAMRIAAMEGLPIIYVFTHDSIAIGQDGATHQPVEMLPSLRAIPGLDVVRPADGEEVVGAYALALANVARPTAIILPRQELPTSCDGPDAARRDGVALGAYVVKKEQLPLQAVLLATGSELHLAMEVANFYPSCRVVSFPCLEAFARQTVEWQESVLPKTCRRRLSIEAAGPMPWLRHVAEENAISIGEFGECADGKELLARRGFSVAAIRHRLENLLATASS